MIRTTIFREKKGLRRKYMRRLSRPKKRPTTGKNKEAFPKSSSLKETKDKGILVRKEKESKKALKRLAILVSMGCQLP